MIVRESATALPGLAMTNFSENKLMQQRQGTGRLKKSGLLLEVQLLQEVEPLRRFPPERTGVKSPCYVAKKPPERGLALSSPFAADAALTYPAAAPESEPHILIGFHVFLL